jgi:hypothetical protein
MNDDTQLPPGGLGGPASVPPVCPALSAADERHQSARGVIVNAGFCTARPRAGQLNAIGRMFFFEKKNQKIFARLEAAFQAREG